MMKRNIQVELVSWTPVENQTVELVERKGVGHPDYIADSASEVSSIALSKYYKRNYDHILHHNLDKVLLVGGQAKPYFGSGELLHPITIIVSGRATEYVFLRDGSLDRVPIGTLIVGAVKEWIKKNLRFLDPDRHVKIDYLVRSGSQDLIGVFELGKTNIPLANDTSFGVSFAPLSKLEQLVLMTERNLNSREFKEKYPEVGEDIKVMGLRTDKKIKLTVAAAMISMLIKDMDHYLSVKEEIHNKILDLASKIAPEYEVEAVLNAADNPDKGIAYLTVTGTSAEHGDDGMTGRGNRANGLITPLRPMSLEATAGKNPISHTGKLYNVLAQKIANRIIKEEPKVDEVYVEILSRIGAPIDQPQVAVAKILTDAPQDYTAVKSEVEEIIDEEISNVVKLTDDILGGKVTLF